jgi:hypothetical protein
MYPFGVAVFDLGQHQRGQRAGRPKPGKQIGKMRVTTAHHIHEQLGEWRSYRPQCACE